MKKSNLTPVAPAVAMKPVTTTEERPKAPEASAPMQSIRELSIEQLRDGIKSFKLEVKRRDDEREAAAPKKGDVVRIEAKGRFNGKVGKVVISRKTKAFVEVEGVEQPAYVAHDQLTKVEQ